MPAHGDVPMFPMARPTGCPFDPPPEYGVLRQAEQPTRMSTPAGVDVWVFSRYDDVRRILADPRLSSRSAPSAHVILNADLEHATGTVAILQDDGDKHLRLRRLLATEFTVQRMEAFRPRVASVVEDHLDALLAGPRPVDLVEAFALPIPSLLICELLGVPYGERHEFQSRSATLGAIDLSPEELERASAELAQYATGLVLARLDRREDDLLSRLITRAEAQGAPLAVPDLVSVILTLLIAGHETTSNMIALGVLALFDQPAQRQLLIDRPDASSPAVEELLRYLSVLQFGLLRHVEEDISLGDRSIKAGEYLVAALPAANRDGSVFHEPDRLDLQRGEAAHLAFGAGRHLCLGQHLARVTLQEVFGRLFARIPTLRPAGPSADLEFKDAAMTYGLTSLPVTWLDGNSRPTVERRARS